GATGTGLGRRGGADGRGARELLATMTYLLRSRCLSSWARNARGRRACARKWEVPRATGTARGGWPCPRRPRLLSPARRKHRRGTGGAVMRPARWSATWLAGLLLGLVGCTYWHNMRQDLGLDMVFDRPDDPLGALEKGATGEARILALRCLREPAANDGTPQDQDRAIALLRKAVSEDDQALCRMHGIDALARFRDPRAAQLLE